MNLNQTGFRYHDTDLQKESDIADQMSRVQDENEFDEPIQMPTTL